MATGTGAQSKTASALSQMVEKCNRCGFCQAGCPTYKVTGLEWQVSRGRVALVRDILDGRIDLLEEDIREALGTCLRCGGCTTHCPPQVPTPEIVDKAIEELARLKGQPWVQRVIFRNLLPNPGLLSTAGKAIWLGQVTGAQAAAKGLGITKVLGKDPHRAQDNLPRVPSKNARQMLPSMMRPVPDRRYRVAYFMGCATNLLYPEVAASMLRVLYANSTEVLLPEVVDCGKPPMVYGDLEAARDLARMNIDALYGLDVDAVVTDCATCGSFLKEYGKLMAEDAQYAAKAKAVSAKVKDISEFLDGIQLNDEMGEVKSKITYHDPCHLVRFQKVSAQPRKLLKGIPGLEFKEMAEADMCCGGAGSFSLTHFDLSQQVLERKMGNASKTGAAYVATGCPACMMQLSAGVRKEGMQAEVIHTIQLLDRAYQAK
ncbi:MAG: (Fe-S)-binding protein [Sphingomonadaceae bacterium]